MTPDSGTSPAELFFNRKARLGFQINRTKSEGEGRKEQTENSTLLQVNSTDLGPAAFVKKTQHRGPYRLGEKVRYKLPHVPKGTSPWSKPVTITEVLGFWTYRLSSGSVWNAAKLRRVYELSEPETELIHNYDDDVVPVVPPPPVPLRRSERRNKGVPPQRYSPGP